MSVAPRIGAYRCECCGAVERTSGCVRGLPCRCENFMTVYVDGRPHPYRRERCKVVNPPSRIWCGKCPDHCPHTPEEREAAAQAEKERYERVVKEVQQ